ncbi:MAG: RsmE family RNA methyltransferase [Desulfitobacteriaceae bacterium]|nr:RsmE family RNA methyltransferase [Desulfitobacteriaceae bacterium]MDD4346001.1 RsmE family RNA methyltransferase [Desulfitobacteriaceae bacterium]MDD4400370.1 RsmE family RNA methyltransferase [Desulfitobacteriaceae bacterium]
MYRFKIGELGEQVFWLKDGEREHLVKVLRLVKGDKVLGFDNSGAEWLGEIAKITAKSVACRILSQHYPAVEAHSLIYLVVGLTKSEKMAWIIQKGTELGMSGLVPLRARRSVMRLAGSKALERVERWQKIASEAGKQSRRVRVPLIQNVSDWQELPDKLPAFTQWIIPYEAEKVQPLSKLLPTLDFKNPIAIIIGPEGGFAQAEMAFARENLGAASVTLGPRILRVETAALVALTLVLAAGGDLE